VTTPSTLAGRVCALAGGTGGIGAVLARQLHAEGAHLVLGFRRDRERAERLAAELRESGSAKVAAVEGDLREERTRVALVSAAQALGPPYGLVVLAGDPARPQSGAPTAEELERSLQDNYLGPVLLARTFRAALGSESGAIVLLSTMQAIVPFEGSLAYASGSRKKRIARATSSHPDATSQHREEYHRRCRAGGANRVLGDRGLVDFHELDVVRKHDCRLACVPVNHDEIPAEVFHPVADGAERGTMDGSAGMVHFADDAAAAAREDAIDHSACLLSHAIRKSHAGQNSRVSWAFANEIVAIFTRADVANVTPCRRMRHRCPKCVHPTRVI
jgi:nucleoside-diphosphate-sugar epimerase